MEGFRALDREPYYDRTTIVALAIIGISFFTLNFFVPRFADDLCRYASHFDLAANLDKTWHDYIVWSGRVPTMLLNYTFFSLGEPGVIAFDLLNAISLVVGCALAIRIADPMNQLTSWQGRIAALTIFLALWWFTPNRLGEVVLWKTGAMQYWWGVVLSMFVLWPVLRYTWWNSQLTMAPTRLAGYLCLCVLGGAWLENLSVGIGAVWALLCLADLYHRRQAFNRVVAYGLIAWLLGAAILFGSPGNVLHAQIYGYHMSFFPRAWRTFLHMFDFIDWRLVLADTILIGVLIQTRAPMLKPRLLTALSLALVGITSVMAMSGAPESSFLGRVGSPFEFFLVFASMALFPSHLAAVDISLTLRRALRFSTIALALGLVADFAFVTVMYHSIDRQAEAREELIAVVERGGSNVGIYFPPLTFGNAYSTIHGAVDHGPFFARDITTDPSDWRNRCYARANHVPAVALKATQ